MWLRNVLVVLLALVASGCEYPTLFGGSEARGALGDVAVTTRGRNLVSTNRTGARIFYRVFESETAALSFWGVCVGGDHCPGIEAGATERVHFEAISGYQPGRETAIFYWWSAEQAPGGARVAGPVRSVHVDLR